MSVIIEAGVLSRAMKSAAAIVESANTIPILANVRLETSGGEMEIVTSNLDIEYRQRVPLVSGEGLATTVDARKLAAIAGATEGGAQIGLEVKDGRLTAKSGRSRWVLPVLPVADFPAMPFDAKSVTISMPGKDLSAAIARTVWCAGTDMGRPWICGVYFDPEDGKVRFTSTNGHVITSIVSTADWPGDAPPVIVATKFAREVQKLAAEAKAVDLTWDDRKIRIAAGDVILTGKVIEGMFPDYRRIIPAISKQPVNVDPETLRKALRRIELIGSEKTRSIVFEHGEGLIDLRMSDQSYGESSEQVPAECVAGTRTGFNSAYLAGALEAIGGDTVEIHQASPSDIALIRRSVADGAICGVMPMRV